MTEYEVNEVTTLENNEVTATAPFDDGVQTNGMFGWGEEPTVQAVAPEGPTVNADVPTTDEKSGGMGIAVLAGGTLVVIGLASAGRFVYKFGKKLWTDHKEKVRAKKAYEEWLKNGNQVVGEPVKQETPVEETEGDIVD